MSVEDAAVEAEVVQDPTETQARNLGWRPKEEFTGDEKNWFPADEFLRRGDLLAEISKAIFLAAILF